MSRSNRHAALALAALMLVAAGCGGDGNTDKAGPGAGLEDQRATVVSEFESAVREARYLREDIAAVHADMRAVREAANHEAERAAIGVASLREEIAALRRDMQELSESAASEAERTADEARSLCEEIAAIRAEMSAVREAAREAESLSPDEIAGSLTGTDEYPEAVVIDDEIIYMSRSPRRRYRGPQPVTYAPPLVERRFRAQPPKLRRDGRRQNRSGDAKPRKSQVANTRPPAPRTPVVSNTRPPAPKAPSVSNTRPPAPTVRPAAPVARPVRQTATIPQKKVHVPQPER